MILALWLAAASAQEASGFAELRGTWAVGVDAQPFTLVERVRPTLEVDLSDRVHLVTTVEAALVQGRTPQSAFEGALRASDLGPLLDLAGCEFPEEDNALLGISVASDYLWVDRLYLDLYLPEVDLRIGRQALQWGSARFLNPTDPFPEVLLTEPWRPRRGVNAVRATVPFGGANQVQLVAGVDDALQRARVAARGTVNQWATDFSLVGAWREESDEALVGLDVRGTALVGFWLEGALHLPYGDHRDVYEEVAVGLDYSLPVLDSMILTAQYYRNGAGATHPDDYGVRGLSGQTLAPPVCEGEVPLQANDERVDPFAPFLAARDYGLLSVALAVSPEVSGSFSVLQNLDDGTGMALPTVTFSPTGALQVSLSGQIPYAMWGDGGEFKPREQDLTLDVPTVPGADPVVVDLSSLVPSASLILWTRLNF